MDRDANRGADGIAGLDSNGEASPASFPDSNFATHPLLIEASLERVLDETRPDLVLHATGSFLEDAADQFRIALRRGVSVISTCEELAYPFYRHPGLARELDALGQSHGAVLLGTGVNPGFVMDKLVVTLLGACRSVRRVRVKRIVNASTRRAPLQRKIGAGLTRAAFEERRRTGRFGHIGLLESAHMIADVLGVPAGRLVDEALRPRLAAAPVVTDFLRVETGQVAGIEQRVAISFGGVACVTLELEMYVGAENPRDTITIDGDPPIEMALSGGIHGDVGTAAVLVNAAGSLRLLKPGLRTMLDVPIRFGTA